MPLSIKIQTIPAEDHRYTTCGDYNIEIGKDQSVVGWIKVTDLKNWRMESLIAVHELIEAILARHEGITDKQIDKFDFAYKDDNEPGDEINCPVYKQHQIATGIERILAKELEIDWLEYERKLSEYWRLSNGQNKQVYGAGEKLSDSASNAESQHLQSSVEADRVGPV